MDSVTRAALVLTEAGVSIDRGRSTSPLTWGTLFTVLEFIRMEPPEEFIALVPDAELRARGWTVETTGPEDGRDA